MEKRKKDKEDEIMKRKDAEYGFQAWIQRKEMQKLRQMQYGRDVQSVVSRQSGNSRNFA